MNFTKVGATQKRTRVDPVAPIPFPDLFLHSKDAVTPTWTWATPTVSPELWPGFDPRTSTAARTALASPSTLHRCQGELSSGMLDVGQQQWPGLALKGEIDRYAVWGAWVTRTDGSVSRLRRCNRRNDLFQGAFANHWLWFIKHELTIPIIFLFNGFLFVKCTCVVPDTLWYTLIQF